MNYYIDNFETIECLVPNSFFIQNYSSRLKDTIKTYTENKNNEKNIKIDVNKQYIHTTKSIYRKIL